jgi:DUF1680 family protein
VKAKADSIVNGLNEVQHALGGSGYLSAFPEGLIDRNIQGKSVWAPFYTLHKIMQGLIDQYTLCHNDHSSRHCQAYGFVGIQQIEAAERRHPPPNDTQ